MKKLLTSLIFCLVLAAGIGADYRWTYEGEELADLKLILYLNGDSLKTVKDCDSGITSFDTTLNLDSIGRGLFQLKARYLYSNSGGIYVTGWDDYDNLDGESDGISIARIYAYDTANTAVIAGTKLSMYTYPGGVYKYTKTTVGAGYADFWVTQSGQYRIYAADPPGFGFASSKIITVDTGSGSTSVDTIFGYGMSAPAASPAVNYVTAYMDLTEGPVDTTGNIIPRTDVTLWLILSGYGSTAPRIDSSWGILPKEYSAKPNSSGRAMFRVPANTIITPSNTHWEVSWSASGSTSMFSRKLLFKVRLDTIPDPINLLTATKVN